MFDTHTHTQHICLMFNECLIHLFNCTCLNVMCVCSSLYGLNQKDFWSFYMYWKWFLSLFVFMSYAYFVFHCLIMFCVEKTSVRIFGYSFWLLAWATSFGDFQATSPSCEFTQKGFATHSRLSLRLASHESPRISFFKELFHRKLVLNLSHPF